jgi:cytochrome c nitrite reductase small subunit
LIEGGKTGNVNPEIVQMRKERLCWDCHQNVPHSDVRSLSSTPNAIAPLPKSSVPEWLKKLKNK